MNYSLKRFLSLALALFMVISLLPVSAAFAEVSEGSQTVVNPEGGESQLPDNSEEGAEAQNSKTLQGSGSAEDPILINGLSDLILFRDNVNAGITYKGQYVKLTVSIDLNNEEWTPIGNSTNKFLGIFDGGDNTIRNLKINTTSSYIGLFGYTSEGELKNLTIDNADIDGRLGVGALVGCPFTSDITNIKLTGKVTIDAAFYVGGVAGRNAYGALSDITVDVTSDSYVKATSVEDGTAYRTYVGGVVGFLGEGNTTLTNVTSNIKVIGDVCDIGGIAGIAHYGNTFSNVSFTGSVEAPEGAEEVGGIAGVWHNQAGQTVTFNNVTSTGSVTVGDEDVSAECGVVGGAYNASDSTPGTTGSLVVNGKEVWPVVAMIGSTPYSSLQAAIDAVENGETIVLQCDVNITNPAHGQNALNHARAVGFTLDLNGHTLSADTGNSVLRFNLTGSGAASNVTITVKNGKVVSESNTWCALMAAGIDGAMAIMNLENLTVENSKPGDLAIKAWANGVINAKNVTVNSTSGAGGFYAVGGEIVLNDCTVNQKGLHSAPYLSMAFAVSDGGKLTVNSGTYSSEPTAASEGNNQGSSHGSWVGGVMNSGGTLIINGGTFSNGNYGDDALATAARGLLMVDTGATLEINGGTFHALKGIVDYLNNLGDASKNPVVDVYGGAFSAPIDEKYCGDNYKPTELGNGMYGVKAAQEAWIIRNGAPKFYATLAEAIADAQPGETVMLCANVAVSERITINKNLTISDYGTLTVSFVGNGGITIVNDAVVTFDNFNIDISDAVAKGDAIFCIGNYSNNATLNLKNITVTGDGYSSAYAVFYVYNTSVLNIEGGSITLSNDKASAGGFIKAEQGKDGIVNITDTEISLTDAKIAFLDGTVTMDGVELDIQGGANAINQSALTVIDSTITIDGADGRALTLSQGDVTIKNSTLNFSNCAEGEIRFKKGLSLNVDADSTLADCSVYADKAAADVANINGETINGVETNMSQYKDGTVINPEWVVKVDGTYFISFVDALKSAKANSVIELVADVTITEDWDRRNAGATFTVPVTIDGNDNTIKFTGKISDGYNYLTAFRFEADATVKNLTIDMSEAVGVFQNRFGAISASADLTVENCTFIGSTTYTNARAIIFGEGSGTNIGEVDVKIADSTFTNWKYGVVDNMNAQDAKTVSITDNTFANASVQVSAAESAIFTGNTVSEGNFVSIRSYADVSKLVIDATGNNMTAHEKSVVYNVVNYEDVQPEFTISALISVTGANGEVAYFNSFEAALEAVEDGDTITIANMNGSENKEIDFTKDISFTITGNAPNYALPTVTFQNATVTIKDAEILIPELDARQNATINVVDSIVHDAGGDSIVKSYYNGAINISGTSVVYTMQVTTMGYITVSDTAELHATWQTNVYGNGMIIVEEEAVFNTAALHLTGQDYSGRDNTDANRVGKPATIIVDGATFTVGKVYSDNGADYSYNSSKGINVGTVAGKSAVLDIKNGAKVNIYMANGETANIGAGAAVNVDASALIVSCRAENGTVTLANNGTIKVSGVSDIAAPKVTGSGWVYMNGVTLDADTKLIGAKVRFASGTNKIDGSIIKDGFFQVGIGAYNGVDANVDTANGVVVNVKNATIGSNGSTYAGWIGTGYYDTDAEKTAAMNSAKYVLNIENSIAEFGYLHISNDGELNVKGNAATKAHYSNSEYSFYAGDFIINGTATFEDTDVLALYTKVSCDNGTDKPGTLNVGNGTEYEAERHNGAISSTNFVLYKAGAVNVEEGAKLHIGEYTNIAANAVLNISGDVTALGTITNSGAIYLHAVDATLTTPEAPEVKCTLKDYKTTYADGAYKLIPKDYVAQVGEEKFESLTEAFNAAQPGDEVKILKAGTYALSTSGKDITITGMVDGVEFANIGAKNMGGANVTFNNVTFTYAANSTYKGLQHSGNLVYNNCTINGQVFLYGESEIFNDCAFVNIGDNYNVWTYGAKVVEFNNCTFTCEGKSVLIYSESASLFNDVTVTDCEFKATAPVAGKAAIEMDSSLTAGINLTIDDATTVSGFGSGNVSGNDLWNNKKGNEGKNNDITVEVDDVVVLEPIKTAEVGGVYYTTIKAAMDAATAGQTVTIFAGDYTGNLDVNKAITVIGETDDEGNNLVNISGKLNITADGAAVKNLNINNGSSTAGYISAKDVLVEGCSVVGGNGFRYCYTSGTVTFKDSTITGSTYGIHFDGSAGGNIVIDNCVITGWTSFAGTIEKVAISGTEFAEGNYNQLRFYQDVEMTDCTFNPDMTIDFGKNELDVDFTDCSVTDGSPLTDVIYLPDLAQMGVEVTIDDEPVVVVAMVAGNAYLNVDDAFAAAKDGDTITLYADATMQKAYDVNGMTLTIEGTGKLDVNDKLIVHGESTLNISCPMAGNQVLLGDGAILKDSTINGSVFVFGKVAFRGKNTVAMLYDFGTLTDYYGAEAPMEWTVEKGASLTMTNKARYGLGYGDKITIYGSLDDALSARDTLTEADASFFTHGIVAQESAGWNCNSSLSVEDAYVIIGSNNSFGNKPGNYGGNYIFSIKNSVLDGSRITFYEAISKSEFTFDSSDVKIGTFMTRDADSVFTLINTVLLSTTTSNGTDEGNYHAGKLALTGSKLTYSAPVVVENGVIEMNWKSLITAPSISGTGKIIVDAMGFDATSGVKVINADMTGFNGTIEVKGAVYTLADDGLIIEPAAAAIGDVYYRTLDEAVAAAQDGTVIKLLADGGLVLANKTMTIIKNGHTTTVAALNGYMVVETEEAYVVKSSSGASDVTGEDKAYIDIDGDGEVDANEELMTLQEALDAAQAGQSVCMADDLNINGSITIPSGVTLNLNGHSLTVKSLVGFSGSKLAGVVYDADGDHAQLFVNPENFVLPAESFVDEKGYNVIPVYNKDHYVFSRMEVNTDQAKDPNRGLVIDEEAKTIHFQFVTNMTGDVRRNLLNNGASDNKLKVIVRLEWMTENGVAQQDFFYSDALIEKVCAGGYDFSFTLTGYDILKIDLDTLVVKGMVITESGAVVGGTEWSN